MGRYRQPYSLYKRGKFYYYRTYDARGIRTVPKSTGCTSKAAARSYCDKLFLQGQLIGSNKTFGEYAAHFFDDNAMYVKDRVLPLSDNTLRAYRKYLKNQLLPIFGPMKLTDITYTVLKQERAKLLEEYKVGTVVSIYSTLKHIIDSAYRDQIISVNPFDFIESLNTPMERRDAFRLEEIQLLYKNISSEFKNTILLMALTGMRISEAVGVLPEDCQKSDKNIEYIHLTKQFNHKKYVPLKGRNLRNIPIIPEIKELFGFDHTRLSAMYKEYNSQKKLFSDADDRQLSFHSLRHFFVTSNLTEGNPEIKVKYLVGHSLKGQNNVYVNFQPDDLTEVLSWQKKMIEAIKNGTCLSERK